MYKHSANPSLASNSRTKSECIGQTRTQRLLFLVFCSLVSTASFGQYAGYRPVADLEPLKKRFLAEAEKITSIKSHFNQVKSLSLLAEKMNSEGLFWFKRTDKIRLEYTKPFRYLVILNQAEALIRDEQKENKIPAQASRALRQVNHLLADVMQGKIMTNSDFTSKVFENDKSYLIELTPKSKALASIYLNINIFVDRKDFSVSDMEMMERNGDRTLMKFVEKEFNAELSEELFSIH